MVELVPDDVEADILSMAVEDVHGLYEIVWSLNVSHPTVLKHRKLTAARGALRNLLDRGFVVLHNLRWHPSADLGQVPPDAIETLLEADRSWEPADEYVGFVATDEGHRLYVSSGSNP